jgi:hypothetical protein
LLGQKLVNDVCPAAMNGGDMALATITASRTIRWNDKKKRIKEQRRTTTIATDKIAVCSWRPDGETYGRE